MSTNRLNLGCGRDIRDGFVNVDNAPLDGVDVVHDLAQMPWPFADDSVEEILAKDLIEHIEDLEVFLRECHRVLRRGGCLIMSAPHFTSRGVWVDPTHRRAFAFDTLDFFTSGHHRAYYWDFHFSERRTSRIVFERSPKYIWNRLFEFAVNINDSSRRAYESTPLRLFPALNVHVVLVR